jgi:hypothetical protein
MKKSTMNVVVLVPGGPRISTSNRISIQLEFFHSIVFEDRCKTMVP